MKTLKYFFSFIFVIFQLHIDAQVYPIRTQTYVIPPYPTGLEDIYTKGNNKVNLQVIVNDAKISNYPVKFKLTLTSNTGITISTNPAFRPLPIYLNGGETQVFNSSDLAAYFNIDNLLFSGYNKRLYKGTLPDGVYMMKFEVVDYNRNVAVSQARPGMIWIFENEPPYLNFPANATEISARGSQNINFNWSPRQNPFSTPTFAPNYKFELWEIKNESASINYIISQTQPLHSITLNTTNYIYTLSEPLLHQGVKYAWRIQVADPERNARFKNLGYTEVRSFRYGKICKAPTITPNRVEETAIGLSWKYDPNVESYNLRFRESSNSTAEWKTLTTTTPSFSATGLRGETSYQFQICATCEGFDTNYASSIVSTVSEEDLPCGTLVNIPISTNTDPLTQLEVNQSFRVGDFSVKVTEISGNNGTFSGKGVVIVPYLKGIKVKVEFTNVSVNQEYKLTQGEVVTIN